MKNLTRRSFIKQITAAGAGTALLPGTIITGEERRDDRSGVSDLLLVSPCLVKPVKSEITVCIVCGKKPIEGFIDFKETGTAQWQKTDTFYAEKQTPLNITLNSLKPDTSYEYRVKAKQKKADKFIAVSEGSFKTQKMDNTSFSFAMISDSHIKPNEPERIKILLDISRSILARKPDYLLTLGDNIQTFTSHGGPMTEKHYGPILYYMLRYGLDTLQASVPVFNVIGNWEGENGWHPEEQRAWARMSRTAWMPGPLPGTYPEGGGEYSDYYAFTWGNTLNIVLTVTGYTTVGHVHGTITGRGDDWTLGKKQKEWLYKCLSTSRAKWKFIYIHHTVSGKAGDDLNTRYGRGGGQAAKIGEQKLIHKWMKKYNVNALFYGHDHVFTDIPVDGIHYTCVGSAGAPWKFTTDETGYEKYIPDSGYTWVDIEHDKIKVSFITPDRLKPEGKILYQYSII